MKGKDEFLYNLAAFGLQIDEGGGSGGSESSARKDNVQVEFGGEKIEVDRGVIGSEDSTGSDKEQLGKRAEEQPELPKSFKDNIAGKSEDELAVMLFNAQSKITAQGQQLGKIKKQSEGKRTLSDVKTEKKEVESELTEIEEQLKEMDPIVDEEDYPKLEKKQKRLEGDLTDMKIREQIDEKYNAEYNEEFIGKMRETYNEELGIEFEDEAWNQIVARAQEFNGAGKLSKESMEAAMVHTIGSDRYRKALQTQGEMDMRDKMSKAGKMKIEHAGDGKQRGSSVVNFDELPPAQQEKFIKSIGPDKFVKMAKRVFGDSIIN